MNFESLFSIYFKFLPFLLKIIIIKYSSILRSVFDKILGTKYDDQFISNFSYIYAISESEKSSDFSFLSKCSTISIHSMKQRKHTNIHHVPLPHFLLTSKKTLFYRNLSVFQTFGGETWHENNAPVLCKVFATLANFLSHYITISIDCMMQRKHTYVHQLSLPHFLSTSKKTLFYRNLSVFQTSGGETWHKNNDPFWSNSMLH